MRTDLLITQTLVYFNNFLEEEFRLPIYQIELLKDDTGIMEFVTHTENMTQEQAHSYFLKFGVLMCFIKLFGIGDIHYENIIATVQGPVIVDLECALNPIIIKTESIKDTCIGMIKDCFQLGKIKNATFTVEKQFHPLTHWKADIVKGFLTAARCFEDNQDDFVQHYFNLFQEPLFCRIVPMETGDFYTLIYRMIYSNKEIIEHMLQTILSNISKFLKLIWNIEENFIDKGVIWQSVYENLFYGNIPFLQLSINIVDGHAYYIFYINGEPFAQTIKRPLAALEIEFRNQINWLNSSNAKDSITSLIG
jgi:hypothetical protein